MKLLTENGVALNGDHIASIGAIGTHVNGNEYYCVYGDYSDDRGRVDIACNLSEYEARELVKHLCISWSGEGNVYVSVPKLLEAYRAKKAERANAGG